MMAKRVALLSVGLMIVGFAGGYALSDTRATLTLYHVGGLGAVGLISSGAGAVARGKGYGFWPAFLTALLPAVLVGLLVAYLAPSTGVVGEPYVCGGPVSLSVALLVLALWAIRKRKDEYR
ncbi:hypothetical protein ACFL2Z_00770 [Candidatus Eisenbacteria bacterium]|uniref:Integral membrane protein n=1 Tax=Eiseniibacteriota bacterium TaxID=2212470 RepID=A0ABV6YMY9_UNCEI